MAVLWGAAIRSAAAPHPVPPPCAGHSLRPLASVRSQNFPQIVDHLCAPCLVTIRWRLKQAIDGSTQPGGFHLDLAAG